MPGDVDILVPVPRVLGRRIAYGIDQAVVLADMVHDLTGVPVLRALRAPMWHRRLAGRDRDDRSAPKFARMHEAKGTVALVDDVFTTGTTVRAAAAMMGPTVSACLVVTHARSMPRLWSDQRGIEVAREVDGYAGNGAFSARVMPVD